MKNSKIVFMIAKNGILQQIGFRFYKQIIAASIAILFCFCSKAQIANYPLTSSSPATNGNVQTADLNVNAGTVTVGNFITSTPAGNFSSQGLNIKLNGPAKWPDINTSGYHIDIPISPKANFYFTLSSINFSPQTIGNSEPFFAEMTYETNGSGVFTPLAAAVSCNSIGTFTITGISPTLYFKGGNTYLFRLFFKGTNTTKNQNQRIKNLIFNGSSFGYPEVHTTTLKALPTMGGNFSANATGTFTIGSSIQPTVQTGFCWVSSPTIPTVLNNTNIVAGTTTLGVTTMAATLPSLIVGTVYNVRTYVITATDTIYGENLAVKAQALPTLNTNTPTNRLSNKATTGGNTIDSGSLDVLEKGVCYATTNNPLYAGTHTSDGVNANNFSTTIKNLLPSTKYYIKAFARNSLGIGYGNLDSFTTSVAVPTIIAIPGVLDFGDVVYNASNPILSYKLTGNFLSPSADILNLVSSGGYTMSTTFNGTYATSISLPYNSSTITNKIIYVKGIAAPYGIVNGMILHTRGGTIAPNADTVFLTTNVVQNQDTLSNSGTDFWCGFGFQESMKNKSSDASMPKLSIYVAATDLDANITVEAPGTGYITQTITIPAGTVKEFTNFPTGDDVTTGGSTGLNSSGLPDARLFATGISNKGIHIYSTNGVPVAAWLHTYVDNNSAAGAMLFPSNTWNSSYTVQSYGGKANNGYTANSYFFVIAKDDATDVTFTPSNPILDSISGTLFTINNNTATNFKYQKGVARTVRLNKGQIFNAMGAIDGDPDPSKVGLGGLDLSGTKISTTCDKKIAVFAGNGRVLVSTNVCNLSSGSDHLIQQMFPSVAWGSKYLTVPTKTMEFNTFRIYVSDPTTKVWVNNPTHTVQLTGLINNLYYQIEGNKPNLIESDKPISVTQFVVAGSCPSSGAAAQGNGAGGDPEMIIISPVQQAINKATVYAAPFKSSKAIAAGGASFINVLIKKQGVSSFKLDNRRINIDTGALSTLTGNAVFAAAPSLISMDSAFKKHPQDTNFYYARFRVPSSAAHKIESNFTFNATAYGISTGNSSGESYGYNAGTLINNLSAVKFALNPFGSDTSTGTVKTCKNNLVTLQIALPYDTTTVNSIDWNAGLDATLYTPIGSNASYINPSTLKPQVSGVMVRDGRTFYIYTSPVTYKFLEEGAFKVKVTINGTFANDCGGTDNQFINVLVGHDDISFTATPAGCGSTNVTFADATTPLSGTKVLKWAWNFGDGSMIDTARVGIGNAPNPTGNPHTYPANTNYTIKLTTINSVGCFSYDSVVIDLAFGISSTFTIAKDTICPQSAGVFTPTSSSNAVWWFWNYGDGTAIDSFNTPNTVSHTYVKGDTFYVVKHWVKNAAGCASGVVLDTINILHLPVATISAITPVCLPVTVQFFGISDSATFPSYSPYTYTWNFDDPTTTLDISNNQNDFYTYTNTGNYLVSLIIKNKFGCASVPKTMALPTFYVKPTAIISNTSTAKICAKSLASFVDASTASSNQIINTWHWDFGIASKIDDTSNIKNPQYAYQTNKLDTVSLFVKSDKGCSSDTAKWIVKVNPLPNVAAVPPSSCVSTGAVTFIDISTMPIDDSVQTPLVYNWNFGDPASAANNTASTKDGTHTFSKVDSFGVLQTITTANGCSVTDTIPFIIAGSKPIPYFEVLVPSNLCSNLAVQIKDTSRIVLGTIKRIEILWDITNPASLQIDATPVNKGTTSFVYSHKYPTTSVLTNYTIRLRAFSGSTCLDSLDQTITLNPTPNIAFATMQGICKNAVPRALTQAYQTTFPALLLGTFVYSGNAVVGGNFDPNLALSKLDSITAIFTTNMGCKDTTGTRIKVWDLPTSLFSYTKPSCELLPIVFKDSSIAAAGTGNIKSWIWNFDDLGSGALNTANTATAQHTFSYKPTTYNVLLTVTSDSGCISPNNFGSPVFVYPKPTVGFTLPLGVCLPVGLANFIDTSKIADNTQADFVYNWNFGDTSSHSNNVAIGTLLANVSHNYTTKKDYDIKLIVASKMGCLDSATKTLLAAKIITQPHTTFIVDTPKACEGATLNFTDKTVGIVTNSYWLFEGGAISANGLNTNHKYNFNGSFNELHFVDVNGCRSDTANKIITIDEVPVVDAGPDIFFNLGDAKPLQPKVTGSGVLKYLWEPATRSNFIFANNVLNATCRPTDDMTFKLTATSQVGCSAWDTMHVKIRRYPIIPNAFSPNGDGKNDKWVIANIKNYVGMYIQVFNRYGQMVFSSTDSKNFDWDGTMLGKGEPLPVGTYYYIMKGTFDLPTITGNVIILR
jgi:gliding motility-associated-like protein